MATARDEWVIVQKEWKAANDAARAARQVCTKAFADCAAGRGPGPSDAQLVEADDKEAVADGLRALGDSLVRKALGFD